MEVCICWQAKSDIHQWRLVAKRVHRSRQMTASVSRDLSLLRHSWANRFWLYEGLTIKTAFGFEFVQLAVNLFALTVSSANRYLTKVVLAVISACFGNVSLPLNQSCVIILEFNLPPAQPSSISRHSMSMTSPSPSRWPTCDSVIETNWTEALTMFFLTAISDFSFLTAISINDVFLMAISDFSDLGPHRKS